MDDYSGCQLGRGVVLGVAPIVWLVHLGALLWWARHKVSEPFCALVLRCIASAVLVLMCFAGVLSVAGLAEDHGMNGVGLLTLAGMALMVVGATAAAFWRFARSPKLP